MHNFPLISDSLYRTRFISKSFLPVGRKFIIQYNSYLFFFSPSPFSPPPYPQSCTPHLILQCHPSPLPLPPSSPHLFLSLHLTRTTYRAMITTSTTITTIPTITTVISMGNSWCRRSSCGRLWLSRCFLASLSFSSNSFVVDWRLPSSPNYNRDAVYGGDIQSKGVSLSFLKTIISLPLNGRGSVINLKKLPFALLSSSLFLFDICMKRLK